MYDISGVCSTSVFRGLIIFLATDFVLILVVMVRVEPEMY